ncbi:MAG: hypothetical protein ABID83_01700 [Candidatus Omnitrophota bacterium]
MKNESIFRKLSIIEFSLFLMAVIALILAIIYFIFFRELDRELKSLEIKHEEITVVR